MTSVNPYPPLAPDPTDSDPPPAYSYKDGTDDKMPHGSTPQHQQKLKIENDDLESLDSDADNDASEKRKKMCISVVKFFFSNIGMTLMVFAYCCAGGAIFEHLEKANEYSTCDSSRKTYGQVRNATVELLWDITNQNDLSDADKKEKFMEKLDFFRDAIVNNTYDGTNCETMEYSWGWWSAMVFAITVVTTVGYGHIAPKTMWGRLVCIAYAILGIPLMLVCLANIGDVMADIFRFVYAKICCCGCCRRHEKSDVEEINKQPTLAWKTDETGRPIGPGPTIIDDASDIEEEEEDELDKVTVPLTITMIVIFGFIYFGALIFHVCEESWPILDSLYFSFITLSTIGFGDMMISLENMDTAATKLKLLVAGLYMVLGMALLSMCFSLMQDEVVAKFTWLGQKMGFVKKDEEEENEADEEGPPLVMPPDTNRSRISLNDDRPKSSFNRPLTGYDKKEAFDESPKSHYGRELTAMSRQPTSMERTQTARARSRMTPLGNEREGTAFRTPGPYSN